ncbi:hypothetical protein H5410_030649, partial [Solanum commersonii]
MEFCHKLDYSGGKLSLEQLTPNQMGSSWTPTSHMNNILHLSPLTLSSCVCGRRTRVHSLELNLMSEESRTPKLKILELKPFELSTTHSASLVEIADQLGEQPGRFHRCLAQSFSIVVFGSLGDIHTGTKGEGKTFWRLAEWVWRFSDLNFFVLSATFVPFFLSSVHAFLQTPNTLSLR